MWRSVENANVGILAGLDGLLCTVQEKDPDSFPDFSKDSAVFLASDYSGQHQGPVYEAYSFVATTATWWRSWEHYRRQVRQRFLLSRRMSFKTLDDRRRLEALPLFLAAASLLQGTAFTLLVSKKIGSLFASSGHLDLSRPELAPFASWKPQTVERLLRVTHLVAFILAGLSREGQDVFWVSDEDDIAANDARLSELTSAVAITFSNLGKHKLGHLRCATTASDDGSLQLEDLVAIADVTAGAVVEVVSGLESAGVRTSADLVLPIGPSAGRKTRRVLVWLAHRGMPLKHIVIALDAGAKPPAVNLRRLMFHSVRR